MPNDPNAPYFDVAYARALSRRLRETKNPAPERAVERPAYSRFQSKQKEPKLPAFDAAAVGQSLREAAKTWGVAAWHALLDGCTAAANGKGAFLLDAQGLVIATRGDVDETFAETLGGRLMLTLDQAAKMGDNAGVVCIEIDSRWLTGIKSANPNLADLTLGIVGEDPVGRDARRSIAQLLESMGGSAP